MLELNENLFILKTRDERVTIITREDDTICINQIIDGHNMTVYVSKEELAMITHHTII